MADEKKTIDYSKVQMRVWDFTFFTTEDEIVVASALRSDAQHWEFSEEACPTSGRRHYQGRVVMAKKVRMGGLKQHFPALEKAHWSLTSGINAKNFTYTHKNYTHLRGPWTDKDPNPQEKTDDVRIIEQYGLWPWQAAIYASCEAQKERKTRDRRSINFLIDRTGNTGKGTFKVYMAYHRYAKIMRPFANVKDFMGFAIDNQHHAYICDIPRTVDQKKLREFYSGLETIKDGVVDDSRFKHRQLIMERPCIWVFSNQDPDMKALSADRYKCWVINDETLDLEEYNPPRYIEEDLKKES